MPAKLWTVDEVAEIIGAYRTERHRLLANSKCSAQLHRRLSAYSSRYFADGRKGRQREMAALRSNWQPCLIVAACGLSEAR